MTPSKSPTRALGYLAGHLLEGKYLNSSSVDTSGWKGKAAKLLGLEGKHFDIKTFARLVYNIAAGWDFTPSAPKGVSIVWVVGDERIKEAFHSAVDETMEEIEAYRSDAGRGYVSVLGTTKWMSRWILVISSGVGLHTQQRAR